MVQFYEACRSWGAPCDWYMGLMKWALDYLGAHPACVLYSSSGPGEYQKRVEAFIANPNKAGGEIANRHGWHNCATVIDPLVEQPPTGRTNDVGYRLSDTGILLAEWCRAVLPEDVMLTTGDGESFGSGHAGCDAWAADTEESIEVWADQFPDCWRSARLAEEWMRHHYGVHLLYGAPNC